MDSNLNGGMDGSLVLNDVVDEAPDELLARRLKNRERQRRYRARKRHEADLKKASSSVLSPTTSRQLSSAELMSVPVEVDVSVCFAASGCSNRVYCPRDWKKDARRGPLGSSNGTASELDFVVANGCSYKRDWKAEARNKTSSGIN